MSKNNVNPTHYKVAGRMRQGEDIAQARNKQKHAESLVAKRTGPHARFATATPVPSTGRAVKTASGRAGKAARGAAGTAKPPAAATRQAQGVKRAAKSPAKTAAKTAAKAAAKKPPARPRASSKKR